MAYKQQAFPVREVLAAMDTNSKAVWKELADEEKKCVNFWLLNRYASSVDGNREAQELAVFKTNEFYNKYYFEIAKHPKLLWYLLCMTGNEQKKIHFHEWIGFKKKESDSKITKFLETVRPDLKADEIAILEKTVTKAELKELARDMGYEESEIKKML